jgi:hypothetical protein
MLTVLLEVSRQTGSLHRQSSGSSSVVSASSGPASGSGGSSASQTVVSSAPFLLMSLQVVSALLSLLAPTSANASSLSPATSSMTTAQVESDAWRQLSVQLPSYASGSGATTLTRHPLRREHILLSSHGPTSSNSSTTTKTFSQSTSGNKAGGAVAMSSGVSDVDGGVYSSLLPSLCGHLAAIWNGLTLQSDALRSAPTILPPLQCIANMCLSIGAILSASPAELVHSQLHVSSGPSSAAAASYERVMIVTALFPYFPYTSVDANVAVQGSVEEVFARKNLDLLNTTLSQVALSWKCNTEMSGFPGISNLASSSSSTDGGYDVKALEYVSQSLDNLNSRMQKQAATAAVGSTAVSDTTHRLLRCISLQGRRSMEGLDGVLVQLGRLLHAQLHTISRATVTMGSGGVGKGKGGAGRKGVLASIGLLSAIVKCLSEITHTDFLWDIESDFSMKGVGIVDVQNTEHRRGLLSRTDSLAYVANVVSQIPVDLVSALSTMFYGNESSGEDAVQLALDDVLSQCADLLLLLMCRVGVWGRDNDGEDWSSQVHIVNSRVEQLFSMGADAEDDGALDACVYFRSSDNVRKLWLDLWYQCPFEINTHRAATTVMMCVCSVDVSAEERAYFLDILFERYFY